MRASLSWSILIRSSRFLTYVQSVISCSLRLTAHIDAGTMLAEYAKGYSRSHVAFGGLLGPEETVTPTIFAVTGRPSQFPGSQTPCALTSKGTERSRIPRFVK